MIRFMPTHKLMRSCVLSKAASLEILLVIFMSRGNKEIVSAITFNKVF